MVKNPPADAGHSSSIPGPGRSPGEGNVNVNIKNTPVFLPGNSHGQEESGGLQSMVLQRVRHDLVTTQQQQRGEVVLLLRERSQ